MFSRSSDRKRRGQGQAGRARRVQRHHPAGGAGGDAASAPDRCRAGRGLSRPPRARLSGRLHAVAGAVAQAAGRPLGRPGAVGGAAPRLRPRARDRGLPPPGILDRRGDLRARGSGEAFKARLNAIDGKRLDKLDIGDEAAARAIEAALEAPRSRVASVEKQAGQASSGAALHHLDAAAGGVPQARLRRQPHHAGGPAAVRGRRRSAARPSASSPICAPTACRWRRRRSPRAAQRHRQRRLASRYVPGVAAPIRDQGQERPGGPRGDPPDRPVPRIPQDVAAVLEPDQAALYELIWKRDRGEPDGKRPSSSAPRSTSRVGARRQALRLARHRLGRPVRRLPQALSGRPRRRRDGRGRRDACRRCRARRPAGRVDGASPAEQHFTEPPPRYYRSHADQEDGGAGHRPALDLCRDPDGAAASATMCRLDKKRLIPEDKGRLVTAFLESFFQRYVEYDFTADLEEKLDRISDGEIDWKERAARVLARLHGRGRRDQGPARRARCWRRSTSCWRRNLPGQARTAAIRAQLPDLQRPAACRSSSASSAPSSAARTIPNAATPASSVSGDGEARRGPADGKRARRRSGDRPAGDAARRPLRALCPARRRRERREAQARAACPRAWSRDDARSRARAEAAVAAARGRPHPETGKPITRRPRPLRALRPA